jgi:hypothetical protein
VGSTSFTQLIKSSTICIALYKTFYCGNDKLTPTLVGIVSVFQNLRSTLLLKEKTKALNIPFTLTQGDLLQEALVVTFAKVQTQALNIPVKVPLGGGRYAELTEWNVSLCSRLVVSFCILLSGWFFFLASEWLIGRKWRLLIDQISWLLIC